MKPPMKRLLLLFTLCASLSASAQQLMRDVFSQMPDSVLTYLSTNNRLDMIDFMTANMKAEVTNAFEGKSQMLALTDDSLSVQLNSAVRLDMLLLPTTATVDSCQQVVALIYTYHFASGEEERIVRCYSLRWRELPGGAPLSMANKQRLKAIEKSTILNSDNRIINKD